MKKIKALLQKPIQFVGGWLKTKNKFVLIMTLLPTVITVTVILVESFSEEITSPLLLQFFWAGGFIPFFAGLYGKQMIDGCNMKDACDGMGGWIGYLVGLIIWSFAYWAIATFLRLVFSKKQEEKPLVIPPAEPPPEV